MSAHPVPGAAARPAASAGGLSAGRQTLLMMGVWPRLAGASVLVALIWAAVAWAMAEVA